MSRNAAGYFLGYFRCKLGDDSVECDYVRAHFFVTHHCITRPKIAST
jgi:hypothetical protein